MIAVMDTSGESEVNPTVLSDYEPPPWLAQAAVWLLRVVGVVVLVASALAVVALVRAGVEGHVVDIVLKAVFGVIGALLCVALGEVVVLLIAVRAMLFGLHKKVDSLVYDGGRAR